MRRQIKNNGSVNAADEEYPRVYLYRRVVQARLYMDEHSAQPLGLGLIAGEACFSRFHFIRLFKKIYGSTPHQYLISVRIEKAKELLKAGMPVSEVCLQVGFESLSSFTGLFRRRVKATPSQFRANALERKAAIQREPLIYIPGCFAEKKG